MIRCNKFELCPCPCIAKTRSRLAFKSHAVHDLPDQKSLSVVSVEAQMRRLEKKKKGKETDQGLQMRRVLRVLLDIEKHLEGAHSGHTSGKKES